MSAAGRSLAVNREGGYHRRAGSIGQGSSRLKAQHLVKKLKRILLAIGGIVIAAMVAGLIVGGIGFTGIMIAMLAIVAAVIGLAFFPRMKPPRLTELNKGSASQMVGRTELWLEAQRPALPPPAARVVDDLGGQRHTLGMQLETVDQNHPAAREVRKLVGEHLPGMIDSYRKVPPHLRKEERAGSTPDEQLAEGLKKISGEIDSVTRQLADGALDDLAIKHRYLDYRYGEGETGPEEKH